ncbi:CAP family protein [Allocoleopsis franciscana]|nr:CAP family protein [Allocoleopsis franciscana]
MSKMNQQQIIGVTLVGLATSIPLGILSSNLAQAQTAIDLATLQSSALSKHNTYRATHHTPELTKSDSLNSSAQDWANQIASSGDFAHSSTSNGENIYATYTTASSIPGDTLANNAVQSWYSEVSKYDYANPGFSSGTGHFTQVVWKSSTEVGCGAAKGTKTMNGKLYNAFYVVCQYAPAGNVQGKFPDNVLKP